MQKLKINQIFKKQYLQFNHYLMFIINYQIHKKIVYFLLAHILFQYYY